jgi:hypothetical protein
MSKRWKVADGTQVVIGDKRYEGGETFTASDADLDSAGGRAYVTEVRQQAAPKAENKAVAQPEARQPRGPNPGVPEKSDKK